MRKVKCIFNHFNLLSGSFSFFFGALFQGFFKHGEHKGLSFFFSNDIRWCFSVNLLLSEVRVIYENEFFLLYFFFLYRGYIPLTYVEENFAWIFKTLPFPTRFHIHTLSITFLFDIKIWDDGLVWYQHIVYISLRAYFYREQ